MKITLQCAYCGNEDIKVSLEEFEMRKIGLTIQCKCGKYLIKNGVMGHKFNA